MPEGNMPDNVAEQLKKLGTELASVADDKIAREQKIIEAEQLLGSMPIKDFMELAESPVIQSLISMVDVKGLRPGETKHKGTLAEVHRDWDMQDIHRMVRSGEMELVKFTPNETIPLIFNGVMLYVTANEMCEVPRCFYDIYMERQKAMKQARIHEAYLMGVSDDMPDPNWMSDEGATVRAWSTQGRRYGKVSGHIGTGRIHEGDE